MLPGLRALARSAFALSLVLAAGCGGQGAQQTSPAADQAATPAPTTAGGAVQAAATGPLVTVYKSPTCGCCANWVEHMKAEGFQVEVHDVPDVRPTKRTHGVPGHLESCHTALAGGYAIEGHVPADVIRRLLAEKPQVAGIAVPGMPVGSPGMEMGARKDPYDVIAFTKDGQTSVYSSH